ncbi:MAG: alpha/beta hydrolase [Candidatus Eremiobacteraeota bacterium]|nr:alpha/beta hydrolase [Candidatus Eremiobacteraeota bacterium]
MTMPVLFMIHGMWGAGWHWDRYREVFQARGFSCETPTLRYHDRDPHGIPDERLGTTSLLDYAADLEEQIRRLGEAPVIIGHSMGGLLAQILASRGLGRALVLLTPAPPSGILVFSPQVAASFSSIFTKWGFWRKPVRQTFAEAARSIMGRLTPEEQQEGYGRFGYESGRAVFEIGLWYLDRKRASSVDETKVKCPVFIVGCLEDRITPASMVRKIAGKYGELATYREFPHNAHWVLGEPGWEVIAAAVADWIEERCMHSGNDSG